MKGNKLIRLSYPFPHSWDSCGDAKNNPSASSRRVPMQRDGPVFPLQCLSSSPPAKQPWSLDGMESVVPSPSNQVVRYMTKQGWRTKGLVFFLLVFFLIFIMGKVKKKKKKKKKDQNQGTKTFKHGN